MSLTSRLKALLRRRATPEGLAAYEDAVARLARAELVAGALKLGDHAPAFLLPNAEGELVDSEELLAELPLVISFFRGGWCPYCDVAMRAMQDALPAIAEAGGRFVAIWPDTGGRARRIKQERGLTYELLVDVDNAVAMQYGIVFRMPELYRQRLLLQGVDLAQAQGNAAWLLPMTATYIVGQDSVIHYAFVDGDHTNRAEPDAIVAALRLLG